MAGLRKAHFLCVPMYHYLSSSNSYPLMVASLIMLSGLSECLCRIYVSVGICTACFHRFLLEVDCAINLCFSVALS